MWIRIRGSMPLTNGSDPAIVVIDLQDVNKKLILKSFSAYYFLEVHLHHFSKIKVQKKSQNSRNQGFSYYFCLLIEGSGAAGSIPLSNGSGSGRPKYTWIRNTDTYQSNCLLLIKIDLRKCLVVILCLSADPTLSAIFLEW